MKEIEEKEKKKHGNWVREIKRMKEIEEKEKLKYRKWVRDIR